MEVSDAPGALNFAVAEGLAELPKARKTMAFSSRIESSKGFLKLLKGVS